MGDPKGFMKAQRKESQYRPREERLGDYQDVTIERNDEESVQQASRCMDCGTPFCLWTCPIGNYIPEWNDLVFEKKWKQAFELLNATNNLPEMTGRVCPALCEYGCVLGINDDAVTICDNEKDIIEYAFNNGLIMPIKPAVRTGRKVAVIGSGPAGLSCAIELNRDGHSVVVYEKADKAGGLLRYGIPDFKLEKHIVDRRLSLMKEEGIEIKTSINVGVDYDVFRILEENDAVCLAGGSSVPRDLKIEGRDMNGIYFAMDYLIGSNKKVSGCEVLKDETIDAKGKKVVVIGGGDTGSDCVGTANRQGAESVVQIEVLPKPSEQRTGECPWPDYPMLLKTTSSHKEGCERHWSVLTKRFTGKDGKVAKLECVNIEFKKTGKDACPVMREIPGSAFEMEADMVILAVGFVHPEHNGLLEKLGVGLDERGNVRTDEAYKTSVEKVFSAGDMHRGQSLVVWAIYEGRQAAEGIDAFLTR